MMYTAVLSVAVLMAAPPANAEPATEVPDNIRDYIQRAVKIRPEEIKNAEKRLRELKKSKGAKSAEYRDLKNWIEKVRAGEWIPTPMMPNEPAVGTIGVIPYSIKIVQVISKKEMLAENYGGYTFKELGTGDPKPFLVRGVSTVGRADGELMNLNGPVEVTGTHSYATAMGAMRTVKVVEPFSTDGLGPYIKAMNVQKMR